jgi:gas vesicle protein
VVLGATLGALCGAAVVYLFFTDRGRELRDQMEPAIDELRREFGRFQKTIEKVGGLASDGLRAVEEFRSARGQSPNPSETPPH